MDFPLQAIYRIISWNLLSLIYRYHYFTSLIDRTCARVLGLPPESGFLKLNEDILRDIISYLAPLDAFRLSRATRVVRDIARPRALYSVTMHRTSDYGHDYRRVTKFCDYMLDDICCRLIHLHELNLHITFGADSDHSGDIELQEARKDATGRLVVLLQKACNLQSIRLEAFFTLIRMEPNIRPAIVALPSLRNLDISLFRNTMLAEDRDGGIRYDTTYEHGRNWVSMREAICAIRNMQINTLELENLQRESPGEYPDTLDFSFPSVRELVLDKCHFSMAMLIHVFPNLRVLRVAEPPLTQYDAFWVDFDDADASFWSSLDHVEGPSEFFEKWSPTFPIHCVSLTDQLAGSDVMPVSNPRIVRDTILRLVQQTNPRALAFPVLVDSEPTQPAAYHDPPTPGSPRYHNLKADPGQADHFWAPFVASASGLRILNLTLRVPPSTEDLMAVLKPYMAILRRVFRRLPGLELVRLAVIYDTHQEKSFADWLPVLIAPARAEWLPASVTPDQVDRLASRLLKTSVRCLSLSFTAWRHRKVKGGTRVIVGCAAWEVLPNSQGVNTLERITEAREEEIYGQIMASDPDLITAL
ncbi:predicted protein [Postia placenta Mad-698-R]|uniref:F-box domain-containing protein n=1 Tax=Postia placenta MAD-698-R-SB12 TaxID=670580 RepID=A0A1X6N5C7_9APHY|nr:hypothetical protein POSPLADRAFT_1137664 [Postia placenta MAD-698-R-SB12]EED80665.1 predicted protein [Postia placenta Mad-698-R]OSX63817.1 hypothetical protein POSPLADRAFT_1137664 [Postia placenta MAD-698-R-SB12]